MTIYQESTKVFGNIRKTTNRKSGKSIENKQWNVSPWNHVGSNENMDNHEHT